MNWNLREASRALDMIERQVLRLVRRGALAACRVNDRYLFHPVELREWNAERNRQIAPDLILPSEEQRPIPSLAGAIERGGVHYSIAGSTRNEVLDAVARLPEIPAHVDRRLLAEVLRSREGIASTGIGGGIAIPHPRDPVVLHVGSPIISLCFLVQGVDFKAMDGRPVDVLFTLLSPTISVHLRLLSRLVHVLHDGVLCSLLAERSAPNTILTRIRELEVGMNGREQDGGTP